MSYDLFAFDLDAIGDDDALMAWYDKQKEWSEPHSYDDPAVTTAELRAFYRDLIKDFPPMNGPDAPDDDDEADTDYCIGTHILYVSFRWARADQAREVFVRLGMAHGVGVCEISETPAVVHRPMAAATARSAAGPSTDARSAPVAVEGDAAAEPASGDPEGRGEGRLYL